MFILEKLLIEKKVEKELQFHKSKFLKGPIEIIQNLVDLKKIEMEFTQESSLKENDTEKENLYGIMGRLFKGNGEAVKRMDLDCGGHLVEIIIKVNGKIIDRMERDFMFTLGVQSIKDNSRIF